MTPPSSLYMKEFCWVSVLSIIAINLKAKGYEQFARRASSSSWLENTNLQISNTVSAFENRDYKIETA